MDGSPSGCTDHRSEVDPAISLANSGSRLAAPQTLDATTVALSEESDLGCIPHRPSRVPLTGMNCLSSVASGTVYPESTPGWESTRQYPSFHLRGEGGHAGFAHAKSWEARHAKSLQRETAGSIKRAAAPFQNSACQRHTKNCVQGVVSFWVLCNYSAHDAAVLYHPRSGRVLSMHPGKDRVIQTYPGH